ncbi:MAG: hypothetical protein ACK4RF_11815 [Cyclobacteriaceae bacterium]
MSRNKNPLKDLDLFLKQQAASFVSPTPLSERIMEPAQPATTPSENLIDNLSKLAESDRNQFLDLIIQAAEKLSSAENAMLINTALYLKNGDNWKEAIRQYWQNK